MKHSSILQYSAGVPAYSRSREHDHHHILKAAYSLWTIFFALSMNMILVYIVLRATKLVERILGPRYPHSHQGFWHNSPGHCHSPVFYRIPASSCPMSHKVTLYTDGPQAKSWPRRFGVVLISGRHRKEISQGFTLTTNNRMELLAVITALRHSRQINCQVTVYTDSRYVADSIEKRWVFDWEKKDFKGKKNPDLWIRFLAVYRKHQVKVVWIKGHASIPENEHCDALAVKASQRGDLLTDIGYHAS